MVDSKICEHHNVSFCCIVTDDSRQNVESGCCQHGMLPFEPCGCLYSCYFPQMNRMQSGGGMPDMSELMQDPNLRNMYVSNPFISAFSF